LFYRVLHCSRFFTFVRVFGPFLPKMFHQEKKMYIEDGFVGRDSLIGIGKKHLLEK
jgi:hypothetical protein